MAPVNQTFVTRNQSTSKLWPPNLSYIKWTWRSKIKEFTVLYRNLCQTEKLQMGRAKKRLLCCITSINLRSMFIQFMHILHSWHFWGSPLPQRYERRGLGAALRMPSIKQGRLLLLLFAIGMTMAGSNPQPSALKLCTLPLSYWSSERYKFTIYWRKSHFLEHSKQLIL